MKLTLNEFLPRLKGVTTGDGKQYHAKCPAHEDQHASLSVSEGDDGRILLNCHVGCTSQEIVSKLGLTINDLFSDDRTAPASKPEIVARYNYTDIDGNLLNQKTRFSDKSFSWSHKENGKWTRGHKGNPVLYNLPALKSSGTVYVVEGEKDVETMKRNGFISVCSAHGAGSGKWLPQYTEALKSRNVIVIPDNDTQGKNFAVETCNALAGHAASVKMIDLTDEWSGLPEKGDISDVFQMDKPNDVLTKLEALVTVTKEWKPTNEENGIDTGEDSFFSCFKTLDEFEEEEATWLVPGWIPEGQITLLASDGGVGKTTLWCDIVSAISSGKPCILDPPGYTRKPEKVCFLTTEDSVRKKLKKKLRLSGANMKNIITPDFLNDKDGQLRDMKFGSDKMKRFLSRYKFVLCVFDPVQGFVPPEINMGSRNAMRDCTAPLISLGEICGTTFLVVCHTNKRKGAYGRDRIADSADLWDIARSVIMTGFTEEQGIRYLSNEKNNYTELQETILYSFDENGLIQKEGTTWKRDREYMAETISATSAPKRDDCKEYILHALDDAGGSMKTKDLEEQAKEAGYSYRTTRRAKDDLKKNGDIKYFQTGSAKEKTWYIEKVKFSETPEDFTGPFDS
nr:MAG TPA: DNA directed DNA polymerase [Caudoviricetes sp.]